MDYIIPSQGIFNIPFLIVSLEPKLFQFFLESNNEILKFDSDGIKHGSLSSETLMNKIYNCYSSYLLYQFLIRSSRRYLDYDLI